MWNKKLFIVSMLIVLVIVGVAGFSIYQWNDSRLSIPTPFTEDEVSIYELEQLSVNTETITTNLYTQEFIVIQFNVLFENRDAKDEFLRRDAEVRSAIISLLNSQTPEELQGEKGIRNLENTLNERFNDIIRQGEVLRVLTIDRNIQ